MNYLYVPPSARPNIMLSTLPAKQSEYYSGAEAVEEVRHGSSMIDGRGTLPLWKVAGEKLRSPCRAIAWICQIDNCYRRHCTCRQGEDDNTLAHPHDGLQELVEDVMTV